MRLDSAISSGSLKRLTHRIYTIMETNPVDLRLIRESVDLQLVRLRERAIVKTLAIVLKQYTSSATEEAYVTADLKEKFHTSNITALVDQLIIGRMTIDRRTQTTKRVQTTKANLKTAKPGHRHRIKVFLENSCKKSTTNKRAKGESPLKRPRKRVCNTTATKSHTTARDPYARLCQFGYTNIQNPGQGNCLYYAFRDSAMATGLWSNIGPDLSVNNAGAVRYLRDCTARALRQYGRHPWNAAYTIESLPSGGTGGRAYGEGCHYSFQEFIDHEVIPEGRYGEQKAIIGLALAFGVCINVIHDRADHVESDMPDRDFLESCNVRVVGEVVIYQTTSDASANLDHFEGVRRV